MTVWERNRQQQRLPPVSCLAAAILVYALVIHGVGAQGNASHASDAWIKHGLTKDISAVAPLKKGYDHLFPWNSPRMNGYSVRETVPAQTNFHTRSPAGRRNHHGRRHYHSAESHVASLPPDMAPSTKRSAAPSHWTHHPSISPTHSAALPNAPSMAPNSHQTYSATSVKFRIGPSPSTAPSIAFPPTREPLQSPASAPYNTGLDKAPSLQPIPQFVPPPPNLDCMDLSCPDPLTNAPLGEPCGCVLPIKVELRLDVAPYKFFSLVSELAHEIATGVRLNQSQVRIMGANPDDEDTEKTVVLIYLVPFGQHFDYATSYMVFNRFCHKEVFIKPFYFGAYDVLYVLYPGLPPSPPAAPDWISSDPDHGNNAGSVRPLAADVNIPKKKLNAGIIVIIGISSSFALALFIGAAIVMSRKLRDCRHLSAQSQTKPAGTTTSTASRHLSRLPSLASFNSHMGGAYQGLAKTFGLADLEQATDGFVESRMIGEGGFGRVYEGVLKDGQRVAVKVLKRVDQQGLREFLVEVEMLSRLHHRNLVKLIGTCAEAQVRCLIYELIPNGSVESHLHGTEKEKNLLDWDARLKIALGSARALAYLHEDSSPRVIHRDFKSSNILLEYDFTPKVSDFGLARATLSDGNEHISTRVMGTVGYVAPEYAMTGHLLVKSDVYSYGVVLLELLTGLKPVDMSRSPGQENLVTWACPHLTTTEGLEAVVDPSLGNNIPFGSLVKVAAVASMCVQPEVDQRPLMSEVVQVLKLVCSEGDQLAMHTLDMEAVMTAPQETLCASDLFNSLARPREGGSSSFRRQTSSGPLRPAQTGLFWDTRRRLSEGATSVEADNIRRLTSGI